MDGMVCLGGCVDSSGHRPLPECSDVEATCGHVKKASRKPSGNFIGTFDGNFVGNFIGNFAEDFICHFVGNLARNFFRQVVETVIAWNVMDVEFTTHNQKKGKRERDFPLPTPHCCIPILIITFTLPDVPRSTLPSVRHYRCMQNSRCG